MEDNSVYTMIDAGESRIAEKKLLPYLAARGIDTIEHFFISHPHTDHYSGLAPMLSAGVKVNNIYYNAPPEDVSDFNYKPDDFYTLLDSYKEKGAVLHNIAAGFHIEFKNSKIYVLEAKKERQGDVNDYSLIMAWDAGGYRTLFTGDLNKKLGAELAKKTEYRADILKVPHHGVTGIASNEFFDNVHPSLIMVPAHEQLWYHPRGAQVRNWAIKNWQERKVHVCNNGFNGHIKIAFYKTYIDLKPEIPNTTCPETQWYLEPIDKGNLYREASFFGSNLINFLLGD